jgi:flagellar hook-basal body complex protein FliE
MPGPIQPIAAPSLAAPEIRPAGAARPGAFRDALATAIQNVEGVRNEATASVNAFLTGEAEDIHTAALAVQRADLAFSLFLQTRSKVVGAYQEIMRMQM